MPESCFYTQFIAAAIPSIVVIIGWYVTNELAKKRELRSEKLAKKQELFKEIDKLIGAAREYYVGNSDKRQIAHLEILNQTNNIDRILTNLENTKGDLYDKYTELYEAITDGEFGSNEIIEISIAIERYKRIMLTKKYFCDEIENKFTHLN